MPVWGSRAIPVTRRGYAGLLRGAVCSAQGDAGRFCTIQSLLTGCGGQQNRPANCANTKCVLLRGSYNRPRRMLTYHYKESSMSRLLFVLGLTSAMCLRVPGQVASAELSGTVVDGTSA